MAKVQVKKGSKSKKSAASKPAARVKSAKKPTPKPKKAAAKPAKAAKKAAPKPKSKPKVTPKKPAAKKPAPKKAAVKKPARKKAAPKKAAVKKPAPKKAAPKKPTPKKAAPKPAPKAAAKPAPAKAPAKPAAPKAKAVAAPPKAKPAPAAKVVKSPAKTPGKAAAVVAGAAAPVVRKPADEKKKRRPRTRITSSGPATAAWFGERTRPSSFIPAPPRAEAPSLVAAPPASSDRLVSDSELTEFAVRTVPVRVDVEATAGRILLAVSPMEVSLSVGEGVEWDFRYLAGADVIIDELIVEFEVPSPFGTRIFRSRRPGAARPHRQLSGPVTKASAGRRAQYTIRAMNAFKMELSQIKPAVAVVA
jgi:hypothetical protein